MIRWDRHGRQERSIWSFAVRVIVDSKNKQSSNTVSHI